MSPIPSSSPFHRRFRRSDSAVRRFAIALSLAWLCVPAAVPSPQDGNAEVETLRREINQVKSDYETRIRLLEQRLRELEDAQRATLRVVEQTSTNLAAGIATNRALIEREFRSNTEVREQAIAQQNETPFTGRLQQVLNEFIDFGGYFRAGYGLDEDGRVMSAFQAPGALAKYRLGNEAENYGELVFGKNWYLADTFKPDADPATGGSLGPIARFQLRLSFYNEYGSSDTSVGFPEIWASIGNVIAGQPDLKFWAGNRFYRRHDIHLNDFYFLNMSAYGGGFEDLDVGIGRVALAFLGATSGAFGYPTIGTLPPVNESAFAKRNLDLRWYELPLLGGQLETAAVYSFNEGARDPLTEKLISDIDGGALSLIHTHDNFPFQGAANKFSLQAGYQAAKTFTSGFDTFMLNGQTYILPDLEDSWRFRVTENFVAQPADWLSLQPVVLYQYSEFAKDRWEQHWFSVGVRPILHLTQNVSLALEAGLDYVDDTGRRVSDALYKFTLAPQISLGRTYLSRPSLRAFVTYATWGDDFKGKIGGPTYSDRNDGLIYGLQMETWW